MTKKIAFVTAVFVLVFSLTMSIGCTLAYLFTETESVVNTFTPSDIEITLTEEGARSFQMIPGNKYKKDPIVTVTAQTNVKIWLFVKFDPSANADTFLNYDFTLDDNESGWTKGDGTNIPADVWYTSVEVSNSPQVWHLLKSDADGKSVEIDKNVTKAMLNELTTTDKYPTLTFDAAAVQYDNLTLAEAYAQVRWTTP